MGVSRQYDRGERAEALTELQLPVDRLLHSRIPGVAEDAATAQGPRAELHPPLVPTDHLALRVRGGDLSAQRLVAVHAPVDRGDGPEKLFDLPIVVLHAEE